MSQTPSEHKPLSAAMRSNFLRFAVPIGCSSFCCVFIASELKLAWLLQLQKNNEEIQTQRFFVLKQCTSVCNKIFDIICNFSYKSKRVLRRLATIYHNLHGTSFDICVKCTRVLKRRITLVVEVPVLGINTADIKRVLIFL